MGDESDITYRDGDVVWVKLGAIWWPGEVIDRSKVPEDIVIRKDPIAVVKFFEEDSYEIVRASGNIKYYNCSKKNDFIRKGMAAFKNEQVQAESSPLKNLSGTSSRRSKGDIFLDSPEPQKEKQGRMENFPKHVCIAETMMGGNPDILSDPDVVPQKKTTYAAAIFGPPATQKKKTKGTPGRRSKGGTPGKRSSNAFSDVPFARHRRFLGYDDHEVRILIQKPRQEEPEQEMEEGVQMYNCQDCGFKTPRVEVIMMHKKSHLQGVYTALFTKPTAPKGKQTQEQVKRSPVKKPRRSMSSLPKTKTTTIDEDIELLQKGLSIFEDKTDVKAKEPKVVTKPASESKETILKSILCEWDNDLDDENEEKIEEEKPAEKKQEETVKPVDNSCFDFNEEEESEVGATAAGRKIPRVIPETKEKPEEQISDAEFMELMETTTAPKIPEVPSLLKCEQNFHDDATIKFPDKPEIPDPPTGKAASPAKEVATKLTNPKKRFVKSFEDFAAKFLQQESSENSSSSVAEATTNQEEQKKEVSDEVTITNAPENQEFAEVGKEDAEIEVSKSSAPSKEASATHKAEETLIEGLSGKELSDPSEDDKSDKTIESPKREYKNTDDVSSFRRRSPLKLIRSPLKSPIQPKEKDVEKQKQQEEKGDKESMGEKLERSPFKAKQDVEPTVEEEKPNRSPMSPQKQFSDKKKDDDAKQSPLKSSRNQQERTVSQESITKKISESLQDSSLKRFFKLDETATSQQKLQSTETKSLEVSKLKTQLMSKLSSKEDVGRKSPKRNISDVVGTDDPQASAIDSVLPKYSKGKYKSRIYDMSEGNSGLHVAKKRAVTSFEDFLEKKPKKTEEQKEEKEDKIKTETVIDLKTSEEKKEEKIAESKNETAVEQGEKERAKVEEITEQEVISEEVPMELETEILPTTALETNTSAQVDISALTTLAAVSEMSTTLDTVSKHKPPDSELVALDKNVTIVSEKELADGQVEFANDSVAKPLTLSSFSMDFSDSNSESSSSIIKETQVSSVEEIKKDTDDSSKDSEITEQNKKPTTDKSIVKIPQQNLCNFDVEEQIPPSIVSVQNVETPAAKTTEITPAKPEVKESTATSTKLLEILNDRQKKKENVNVEPKANIKTKIVSISSKGLLMKSQVKRQSEQKKNINIAETVSVQKVSSKRDYEDIEDIDKFIIQKKPPAVGQTEYETPAKSVKKVVSKPAGGKAKILQQTIITPTGDIIQPEPPQSQQQQLDDNVMFDINSMPIVLGDQILQPESVDSLPVVISDSAGVAKKTEKTVIIKKSNQQQPQQQQVKLLNKAVIRTTMGKSPTTQTYVKVHPSQIKGSVKGQKFYQIGSKVVKSSPTVISQQGKQGKFIIVPSTSTPTGAKMNVEKRVTITKKLQSVSPKQMVTKVQNIAPEPAGNKIMIVTNQQGQQSRVLLTPAQQKLLGYQTSNSKTKTPVIKGSPASKLLEGTAAGTSNITTKTVVQQRFITSTQLVTPPMSKQQIALPKAAATSVRKTPVQGQRVLLQNVASPKTTITTKPTTMIRNQQTLKKIQSLDEALLDQQVQEQLQAIKASGMKSHQVKIEPPKTPVRQPARRSYVKKQHTPVESKQTIVTSKSGTPVPVKPTKSEVSSLPPLAPISPSKKAETISQTETAATQVLVTPTVEEQPKVEVQQRPLNQLIIQDAQGNQTTITEGQILALPSETVDGQPSTYMLVTLDETGNLTPLNNEALMSLDPNLGLGGDLSNMVLQLDAGNATIQPQQTVVSEPVQKQKETAAVVTQHENVIVEKQETAPIPEHLVKPSEVEMIATQDTPVDSSQQFYVADPATAQKLIESLTEGNADFASLLANAEAGNILIHADGQQILINANTDNQMLLTVNTDGLPESTNNPVFAAQPTKSQDILAAALADTDVFQQDQTQVTKVAQAQLSPNSALYPMNVGNVLETSLTLTSPIMTPLEVPSTNNKKIPDDETDILTQVPKNVDLPITITDPNISQTVAQQQVASLIANELQSNLELPLTISDGNVVVVTTELNSPSYGFSLPSLDDAVDINQKSFTSSISMPLLSEDSREGGIKTDDSNQSLEKPTSEESKSDEVKIESDQPAEVKPNKKIRKSSSCEDSDMMTEGLCTLGGEMCSSLSEPPPDMFDLTVVTAPFMNTNMKNSDDIPERSSKTSENSEDNRKNENDIYNTYSNCRSEGTVASDTTSDLNVDENSCEIPMQPEIVTDLSSKAFDLGGSIQNEDTTELKRDCEEELGNERKRIRAD